MIGKPSGDYRRTSVSYTGDSAGKGAQRGRPTRREEIREDDVLGKDQDCNFVGGEQGSTAYTRRTYGSIGELRNRKIPEVKHNYQLIKE